MVKILLIYTGGTIGMVREYGTGALQPFNFDQLIQRIPELGLLDCEIDTVSFEEPLDSSNVSPQHWSMLANIIADAYEAYDGFVVLHGSDTMSYSAAALSFMLEHLAKPVIFTGSQLPIGDLRTDAKENLITSIQVAALQKNGKPLITEVGLYFEYKLYRGNRTTKINAEHFQAFASLNYPPLAESGVHLKVSEEFLLRPSPGENLVVRHKMDNNVAVLKLFPGLGSAVLRSVLDIPGLKALVLETYGAGNAPTVGWMVQLLDRAIAKGIHIVNVTQCSGGSVMPGHYATSEHLEKLQIINGKDITTEAALAKLMYLLGADIPVDDFKATFETPLRGEMG